MRGGDADEDDSPATNMTFPERASFGDWAFSREEPRSPSYRSGGRRVTFGRVCAKTKHAYRPSCVEGNWRSGLTSIRAAAVCDRPDPPAHLTVSVLRVHIAHSRAWRCSTCARQRKCRHAAMDDTHRRWSVWRDRRDCAYRCHVPMACDSKGSGGSSTSRTSHRHRRVQTASVVHRGRHPCRHPRHRPRRFKC
jgi:hypothetical protein